MRHTTALGGCIFTAISLATVLAAPREARAQLRITGRVGGESVHVVPGAGDAGYVTTRVQGELGLGWLWLGAYAEHLAATSGAGDGAHYGGVFTLRPRIAHLPITPVGFASIGRANFVGPNGQTVVGWDPQLGLGLDLLLSRYVHLEATGEKIWVYTPEYGATDYHAAGWGGALGLALDL